MIKTWKERIDFNPSEAQTKIDELRADLQVPVAEVTKHVRNACYEVRMLYYHYPVGTKLFLSPYAKSIHPDVEGESEAMAIAIYEAVYSDKAARTPWTHLAPGEWDRWRRAANIVMSTVSVAATKSRAAPVQAQERKPLTDEQIELAYQAECAKNSPHSWPSRDWFFAGVKAATVQAQESDELRDALKEHASEIERLTSDVIFEQQAGSLSWIAQAELKEELAAQRGKLEQVRDDMVTLRAMVGNPDNVRLEEKFLKRLESEIQKPDTRDVPLQVVEGKCWCDEEGVGKPGVSCGDCPKDYAEPVQGPKALSDRQIGEVIDEVARVSAYGHHHTGRWMEFARAIEAKIKEQK